MMESSLGITTRVWSGLQRLVLGFVSPCYSFALYASLVAVLGYRHCGFLSLLLCVLVVSCCSSCVSYNILSILSSGLRFWILVNLVICGFRLW